MSNLPPMPDLPNAQRWTTALVLEYACSYAEEAVRLEREALLPDALRYRHVRTLSIRAFGDLSTRNFEGEGAFDDLVDRDIEMREEAIRARSQEEG